MARLTTADAILDDARRRVDSGERGFAAFDADGTMWRGDIGEVAFRRAPALGMIDDDTLNDALPSWLSRYDLACADTASAFVRDVEDWLKDGTFDARGHALNQSVLDTHLDVYAMQTWCYAGHSVDDLRHYGAKIFKDDIRSGVFAHTRTLFDGFRARGIPVVVVSASPSFLIEGALLEMGFHDVDVVAMAAVVEGDIVRPALATAVFGDSKVTAMGAARADVALYTFGDTVDGGDRALLRAGQVNVAVCPRGAHREAALARDDLWMLDDDRTEF